MSVKDGLHNANTADVLHVASVISVWKLGYTYTSTIPIERSPEVSHNPRLCVYGVYSPAKIDPETSGQLGNLFIPTLSVDAYTATEVIYATKPVIKIAVARLVGAGSGVGRTGTSPYEDGQLDLMRAARQFPSLFPYIAFEEGAKQANNIPHR